ncbi:MAG: [FeFe] hydrogenase H-cluster maturation GTPase HydF [Oscillospiraceae bacterium]|nr:[FeFe] hydrogenase H-cluster maturation GTPase HydF [Oscillospiraceae bacterium]MCL2278618.1 [FeFe] hydrogenase H-cluster maturation GTPase HydF [Oscillospiraceae bacterium]
MSSVNNLNSTPLGERIHIGIFGRMGAGKSSLLNAITDQDAAIVSPLKGTTTDPVNRTMELLPLGPVVFIDTPGIDDSGELGDLRIEKAKKVLRKADIVLLVIDSVEGLHDYDTELISAFNEAGVKYIIVYNKSDLNPAQTGLNTDAEQSASAKISVSSTTGENIHQLKELIAQVSVSESEPQKLVADLLSPGDVVVLVIPIDSAAPKGRLILPQQQVARDVLDAGAISVITHPLGLTDTLKKLKDLPKLVVTDSQAFEEVSKLTPQSVSLTSFSILMARYKGVLEDAVKHVEVADTIKDGDKILVAEGCTHHRQCEDIGTVKIPNWIRQRTKTTPEFEFSSGGGFPDELSQFKLIIHCGGCMQNPREMRYRHSAARKAGVPITNYGILISHIKGILPRAIAPFAAD